MTSQIQRDLDLVRASADQLVHDVHLLSDAALREPSRLPGWTRAHLVGHLIGNAEGLTRLLEWARTDITIAQYDDQRAKDEGIEGAVGQPADVLAARLRDATDTFVRVADDLQGGDWSMRVRLGVKARGREIEASEIPWRRLVEQEVHNVDLNGAYTPAHWPEPFVHRLLTETERHYLQRDDVPPLELRAWDGDWSAGSGEPDARTLVEGPAPAMLAWLTGRSSGQGLHVHAPGGTAPELPPWF